jgi:hypothetical protein
MKKQNVKYFLWDRTCTDLGPEDVPPGSIIGKLDCNGYISIWHLVLTVNAYGVIIGNSICEQGITKVKSWERLCGRWLIKRPGRPWEPCYKRSKGKVKK